MHRHHHRRSSIRVPGGKWYYHGSVEGTIFLLAAITYWAAFGIYVAGRSLYLLARKR